MTENIFKLHNNSADKPAGSLEGMLLIATPNIQLSCFTKAVIYICSHNKDGAMGIIINQELGDIDNQVLWKHFQIDTEGQEIYLPLHFGGPLDSIHGFILHNAEYRQHQPVYIRDDFAISSNREILQDIAFGTGPSNRIFALGYAGWNAGQLESELERNSWLVVPATKELVFNQDNAAKWSMAARSIGVDFAKLSPSAGHA